MDKEFEKKVKQKRIRTIAVVFIIAAAVIYLLAGTTIEKADYTKSLQNEIEIAKTLYDEAKQNVGMKKGQYTAEALQSFETQISAAQKVLNDENSEYSEIKLAYETLKAENEAFPKSKNAQDLQELETSQQTETVDVTKDEASDAQLEETNDLEEDSQIEEESLPEEDTLSAEEPEDSATQPEDTSDEEPVTEQEDAENDAEDDADKAEPQKPSSQDESKTPSKEEQNSSADQDSPTEDETDTDTDTEEKPPVKEEETQAVQPEDTESKTIMVSLDIRCDTLAADLSKLRDPSLESYVPADGCILSLSEVEVTKGESVYDVLSRVCRDKGIHLEAVYTPSYGADYVEGINYLYEFDAGEQSGWMYKVNGVFPNYGCSDYILEDGDAIVWAYTCDMGKDLGK